MAISLRDMSPTDCDGIRQIYNHYIETSVATFDEQPKTLSQMRDKLTRILASYPALVAEEAGQLLGFAYANAFVPKSAYRVTAETTVYVDHLQHGRGIGEQLYAELLKRLPDYGVRHAMALISLPNPGSVALHRKLGFERVGHLKQVGCKFGRWLDVQYWQLTLSEQNQQREDLNPF